MIFLSAGHFNGDPGAVANGYKEALLTIELRDMVLAEIKRLGGSVVTDKDSESLSQYIKRIKPGSGSVLCELHFNSSSNPLATGAECLYGNNANIHSQSISKVISTRIAKTLNIPDRGAKPEKHSARGRLAILHTKAGIACLPEIAFISNKGDMDSYQDNKVILARELAAILVEFDNLIS